MVEKTFYYVGFQNFKYYNVHVENIVKFEDELSRISKRMDNVNMFSTETRASNRTRRAPVPPSVSEGELVLSRRSRRQIP
jgi:hypothetical protein